MGTKKTYRAFSAGELAEDMYGRYDVDKYGTGCRILNNMVIKAQGGVYMRPGLRHVCEVGDSTREHFLLPFEYSDIDNYQLLFGHNTMRVLRHGGLVLEAEKTITALTNSVTPVVTVNAHGFTTGQEVYVYNVQGMRQVNNLQAKITVINANTFSLNGVNTDDFDLFVSGKIARVYEIPTPYADGDVPAIYYAQTADVMTLVHLDYPVKELKRTGHTSWTIVDATFAPLQPAPAGVTAAPAVGSGTVLYSYVVTAVANESLEESLPSNVATALNNFAVAGNSNRIIWPAVAGASKYNVYKLDNGIYGYIGSTETLEFIDTFLKPILNDTPPKARNPFVGAGNYPSVVAFQQQRRVFAHTRNKSDGIWMSRPGQYGNLSVSVPYKDDDGISFSIASGKVNAINHLISFRELLMMTTSAEWKLGSDGPLTPTSVNPVPETNYGSSKVKPVVIGNTAIFNSKYGKRVRDYSYTFEADGYDGNDLSILSSHLLKNREISSWAFAQEPDAVIWCVMSDGKMCSITYMREHKVWGWARHETDGFVESVSVVPDPDLRRDAVYFVVRRTVNGVQKRFVEILEEYVDDPIENAFFMDAGHQQKTAEATDTVYGLWHLEGREVAIYADGDVLENETVTDGMVVLPRAYKTILVGLPYMGEMQPMAPEMDTQAGSTLGDPKRIKGIIVQVLRTRGVEVAQDNTDDVFGDMRPMFEDGDLSNKIQPQSGLIDLPVLTFWDDQYVAPYIRQRYPLPAQILTLTPTYD